MAEQERREQEHLAFLRRQELENNVKMNLKSLTMTIVMTTHLHNTHLNEKKNGDFSYVWCFMHKCIVEINNMP